MLERCFELQDALAILEIDRVLDPSPDELELHRAGLAEARRNRVELIAGSTARLMARMDAAAGTANAQVLLHSSTASSAVRSSNQVSRDVGDFQGRLGMGGDVKQVATRRWTVAAADAGGKALNTGAIGVAAAKDLSAKAGRAAGATTGRLTRAARDRAPRTLRGRDKS